MSRGRLTGLGQHLEHAAMRMLQDCLAESMATYWRRRAEDFRSVGTATCDEIAQACENRARVSIVGGDIAEFYALLEAGEAP